MKGTLMLKIRRRAGAAVAGSDLPYCAMCQQSIRIDAVTGRCALGHRAAAPTATAFAAEQTALLEAAPVADAVADPSAPYGFDTEAYDPYDTIVYGRSDADYTTDNGAPVTWDAPAASAAPASETGALEEYATWGEPSDGLSSLDVDTEQLPAQPSAAASKHAASDLFDELDDLDDATHARRTAVGTVGGTIAVSGMVLGAIAALPF